MAVHCSTIDAATIVFTSGPAAAHALEKLSHACWRSVMYQQTGVEQATLFQASIQHLGSICSTQKCAIRFTIVNSLKVKNIGDIVTLPYLNTRFLVRYLFQNNMPLLPLMDTSVGLRRQKVRKVRQTTGNEARFRSIPIILTRNTPWCFTINQTTQISVLMPF